MRIAGVTTIHDQTILSLAFDNYEKTDNIYCITNKIIEFFQMNPWDFFLLLKIHSLLLQIFVSKFIIPHDLIGLHMPIAVGKSSLYLRTNNYEGGLFVSKAIRRFIIERRKDFQHMFTFMFNLYSTVQ